MVHRQEKSWSIEMEPEMAGMMELVDKAVETTIMSLLYMFKKIEDNKGMMKWQTET